MKPSILIAICLAVLTLSGCEKEKLPDGGCVEYPPRAGNSAGSDYEWSKVLPYYDLPCFNPNNPDEIIVRAYNNWGDTTFQLLKYNLSTRQKAIIYEGNFAIRPRWSRKDWILLNLRDFNIYKIKSNGDSLTQLTDQGKCLGGEWNLPGDKFIYELVDTPNLRVISDDLGNLIGTIEGGAIAPSWQHDSLVVVANHSGVSIAGAFSEDYQYITYENGSIATWTSAEWLDNENVIWANREGIVTANIINSIILQVKESCYAQVYKFPTVSFDSQKVIFQRDDKEVTSATQGKVTSRLFMMNFDGGEEEEIIIPE